MKNHELVYSDNEIKIYKKDADIVGSLFLPLELIELSIPKLKESLNILQNDKDKQAIIRRIVEDLLQISNSYND